MPTSNPALRDTVFAESRLEAGSTSSVMTIQGATTKTLILLGILSVAAIFTYTKTFIPDLGSETASDDTRMVLNRTALPWVFGGGIVGFILAIVTSFAPRWSPYLAPLYAGAQGLFLGGMSAVFESAYSGIVLQAVALTIGTLLLLLTVYATGLVPVTQGFRAGVFAATGAIALVYLVSFVVSLFGVRIPIFESGLLGIGFSIFVVVIASLNLVLDFDFISTQAQRGAPKYMEWYCGFGLLVTLIWLYMEILRLLAKLSDRRS
jgi:uncharacterized YccA/Bax inhibitor family protein